MAEITSVANFIKEIENIDKSSNNPNKHGFPRFYRGQSSISWKITPSLFRKNNYVDERSLLPHIYASLWNDLHECKTGLEKLVKVQHYGLPTRLLDITTNPLVALYFACNDNSKNSTGCVYCGNASIDNNKVLSTFLNKLFLEELEKDTFDKNELKKIFQCSDNDIKYLTKGHRILAPYNNPRIISQSGSFFIPPMLENNNNKYTIFHKMNYSMRNSFQSEIVTIPYNHKQRILTELNVLGINEGTLFPELEHQINAIYQSLRK